MLAAYDASADRYDVWCANQGNAEFAHLLSIMSGIPQEKLRVQHARRRRGVRRAHRAVSGISAAVACRQAHRAAGEVAVHAVGGFPHRQSRPRGLARGRTGLRQTRQIPGHTDGVAVQFRRLSWASRRAHQFDQRQSDRRGRVQGRSVLWTAPAGDDQYVADERVSRRRTPGGEFYYRATGRRSGGEARSRSVELRRRNLIPRMRCPTRLRREAASTAATSPRCSKAQGKHRIGMDLPAGGSNRRKTASCAASAWACLSNRPAAVA